MRKYFTFLLLVFVPAALQAQSGEYYRLQDPVLEPGSGGSWDSQGVFTPWVINLNGTYHMWYGGNKDVDSAASIGHATSGDGITWSKDSQNPVLSHGSSGSWNESSSYIPVVIFVNDTFRMWFCGGNRYLQEGIGYATSTDGSAWTFYDGNPVFTGGITGSWDDYRVSPGSVNYYDGVYHMWYSGGSITNPVAIKIGFATSTDGIHWTRYEGNPVMDGTSGNGWTTQGVQASTVIIRDGNYNMWYSGGDLEGLQIGYASSSDGFSWNKNSDPVLDTINNGRWDSKYVASPTVIYNEGRSGYELWFTGAQGILSGSIGYAAQWSLGIPAAGKSGDNFALLPNPAADFISISLPGNSRVADLTLINVLGQIVLQKRIVPEEKIPVSHLGAGVYLYRIEVGGKMFQGKFIKR